MKHPHLVEYLTKNEFRLVFSIALLEALDAFSGSYGISRYATPGDEGPTRDWLELLLRSIRFLYLEHRYPFQSLDVRDNGSVLGIRPICHENLHYVILLDGSMPDAEYALPVAIQMLQDHAPSFNLEPLQQALAQVRRDVAMTRATADPEQIEALREHRREAFRALTDVGRVN